MMLNLSKYGGKKVTSCLVCSIRADADWATAPPSLNVKFRSNQSNWYCDKKVYDLMLVAYSTESCKAVTAR